MPAAAPVPATIVTGYVDNGGQPQSPNPNWNSNNTAAAGEAEVHFNAGVFVRAPQVVVTPHVPNPSNYAASVYKVSTTGFSVWSVNLINHPENIGFDFIAIQTN